MGELKHCYKCMEEFEENFDVCPNCGYDSSTPNNPMYITPGTLLREKYLCGILLDFNGEGATYTGKDITTGRKIRIREYMPINLCTRVNNRSAISVNYNNLAKYKAFMAEYTELNKSLARIRDNPNIPEVIDMFAENNTTYTIFEHVDGVKMLDYLKENAGELSWDQVSRIFPPLFTTIGILHNAGIIHRAISPDTVYINDKGELKLCGFSVSSVRTVNAGLEYELFKGYAAPEQYSASSNSRQGTWTDVYGISALLYRALTGCMPVDSVSRLKHDDLHEPYILDSRIPSHVSGVIMKGMDLSGKDRIQTITELVTKLFEQPSDDDDTATTDISAAAEIFREEQERARRENEIAAGRPVQRQRPPQRRNPQQRPPQRNPQQRRREPERRRREDMNYRYERVSTADKIKAPIIIGVLFVAILALLGVFIYTAINPVKEAEDPRKKRPTSSSVSDNVIEEDATIDMNNIEMPSLIGRFYEQTAEKWSEYFKLDPVYEYNDSYDIDIIYEQEIEEGTRISQGTVIEVKVSKGKLSAFIPDFEGLSVAQYKLRLEKAGIPKDNYELMEAKNGYGNPDSIVEIKIDDEKVTPGSLYSNKDGKKLIIYYISDKTQSYTTYSYYNYTTTASNNSTTEQQYTYVPVYTTQAQVTEAPATQPPVVTEPPTQAPPPVVTDPPAPPVVTDPPAPPVVDSGVE
ncbi:MAG: PASTA domain-containing protein [Ruminococcus sp.]|nr:PASTA domain-containing protein [Ruminococcus sp.]